jgi:Cdc6-like AAA superfamily ATPase
MTTQTNSEAPINCGLNQACRNLITHAIEQTLERDREHRQIENSLQKQIENETRRTTKMDEIETIKPATLNKTQRKIAESYHDQIQYIVKAAYKPPHEYTTVSTYLRLNKAANNPEKYGVEELAPGIQLYYDWREVTLHINGFEPTRINIAEADDKRYIELGTSDEKCLATTAYLANTSGEYEPLYDQLVNYASRLLHFKPGAVDLSGYDDKVNKCNSILRCSDPRIMKRHILLAGPPGCGKSMIAKRVVAENPEYSTFYLTSSPEAIHWLSFFSKIIKQCRRKMLLVIDELDELGTSRDHNNSSVYQLLRLMDGAEDNSGLTILATTNRPQALDEALLRPGRFGPAISVEAPTPKQAAEIIRYYNEKYSSMLNPDTILSPTQKTPTGAHIRISIEDCIINENQINDENVAKNLEANTQ